MTSPALLRRLLFARERTHLRKTFQLVWTAARGWTVVWASILIVLGLLPLAVVYLTRDLVNEILQALRSGGGWDSLVLTGSMLVAVLLLLEILRGFLELVRVVQAERVRDHASLMIHEQCCRLDVSYYESPEYHDRLHRAAGEGGVRALALVEGTGSLLMNGITLAALAIVLIPYAWWLPLALLGSAIPAFLVLLRHNRRHHEWWERTTPDRRWAA